MGNTVSNADKQRVNKYVGEIDLSAYIDEFKKKYMSSPLSVEDDLYILLDTNIDEIRKDIEDNTYLSPYDDIETALKLEYYRKDKYIYTIYSLVGIYDDDFNDISLVNTIIEKNNYDGMCEKVKLVLYSYNDYIYFKDTSDYTGIYPKDQQKVSNVSNEFKTHLRIRMNYLIKNRCNVSAIKVALQGDEYGHANIILVEKYINEILISLYEPHGSPLTDDIDVPVVMDTLKSVIEEELGNKFIVKLKESYCNMGIQSLVVDYDIGYCQLFSLLWLDLNLFIKNRIIDDFSREFPELPIATVGVGNIVRRIESLFIESFSSPKAIYEAVMGYCYSLITKYLIDSKIANDTYKKLKKLKDTIDDDKKTVEKVITYREAIKLINLTEPPEIVEMKEETKQSELSDKEIIEGSYETYISKLNLLSIGKLCTSSRECESNCCKYRGEGEEIKTCQTTCNENEVEGEVEGDFPDYDEEEDFLDILDYRKDDSIRVAMNEYRRLPPPDIDDETIIGSDEVGFPPSDDDSTNRAYF